MDVLVEIKGLLKKIDTVFVATDRHQMVDKLFEVVVSIWFALSYKKKTYTSFQGLLVSHERI
jgi:hypothetical protein